MQEIILNKDYKYVYNKDLELWWPHYKGIPFPRKPKNLFKYYALNLNNIAALYQNYFWLSNPSDFNDPFDCNINLIEFEEKPEWSKRGNNHGNVGVCCFTESINDPTLWAFYTNYNGFVLEFNPEKTTVGLNVEERTWSLNPVMYFDELIKVKNTEHYAMEYLLTAKLNKWKNENEWRFVTTVNEESDRIVQYKPHSVKALYIGHKIPDEQLSVYNLIFDIFIEKYPKAEIYVVFPNPQGLELVFEKVWPD